MKKLLAAAAAIAALVGLDQFTKLLATQKLLGNGYFPIVGDIFGLEYVENTGAAFGIFQNMQWLFICSSVIVVGIMIWIFVKLPFEGKLRVTAVLILLLVSGALGNMIDRVKQGYVVDFLYFKLINFPVFNVADCYVVVSVIIFAILLLFYYSEEDLESFGAVLHPGKKKKAGEDCE